MQHSRPLLPLKSYAVSSNVQCSLLGICVCYISSGCLQAIRSVLAVSSTVGQNDLEYVWQAPRDFTEVVFTEEHLHFRCLTTLKAMILKK